MRWFSLLLTVTAFSSAARAQFLYPSSADRRFATPVVEGTVEERPPRRDELGYLRVPRLRLSALAGMAERVQGTYGGGEGTHPFAVGGSLQLEVPITGALVVGATGATQWRRLNARWSQYERDISRDRSQGNYSLLRSDVGAFVRARLSVWRLHLWAAGGAGWSRQRDLEEGGARHGFFVAPEVGVDFCAMICTGLHAGYAYRRFHRGGRYDPATYGELYAGLSLSVPLWSPR